MSATLATCARCISFVASLWPKRMCSSLSLSQQNLLIGCYCLGSAFEVKSIFIDGFFLYLLLFVLEQCVMPIRDKKWSLKIAFFRSKRLCDRLISAQTKQLVAPLAERPIMRLLINFTPFIWWTAMYVRCTSRSILVADLLHFVEKSQKYYFKKITKNRQRKSDSP